MEICSNRFIPKIILALCLSIVFQFIACAQATSGDSALRIEQSSSVNANSSTKLIENSKTVFDFRVLGDQGFEISDCVVGVPLGQRVRGAYLSGVES